MKTAVLSFFAGSHFLLVLFAHRPPAPDLRPPLAVSSNVVAHLVRPPTHTSLPFHPTHAATSDDSLIRSLAWRKVVSLLGRVMFSIQSIPQSLVVVMSVVVCAWKQVVCVSHSAGAGRGECVQ